MSRKNSLNRKAKTKEYRHNDKVPTRWPFCRANGRRQFCVKSDNRVERRKVKEQINSALIDRSNSEDKFDGIETYHPPADTWKWD